MKRITNDHLFDVYEEEVRSLTLRYIKIQHDIEKYQQMYLQQQQQQQQQPPLHTPRSRPQPFLPTPGRWTPGMGYQAPGFGDAAWTPQHLAPPPPSTSAPASTLLNTPRAGLSTSFMAQLEAARPPPGSCFQDDRGQTVTVLGPNSTTSSCPQPPAPQPPAPSPVPQLIYF